MKADFYFRDARRGGKVLIPISINAHMWALGNIPCEHWQSKDVILVSDQEYEEYKARIIEAGLQIKPE